MKRQKHMRSLARSVKIKKNNVVEDKFNVDDKKYLLQSIKYYYKSKIKIHLDYYDDYDEKPGILYSISKSIDAKLNL